MITYTNSLDFCPGGVPLFVRLSQYDSNFSLVFNCFSHKGDFTVENGSTAVFREHKPDGNVISIDATVSGTIVTLTPSATNAKQMTAIKGHCECEISLQKNGKELSSANFVLLVEKAPVDIDAVQSDSVVRELYDVADRAEEILEAAETVDEAISDLPNLIDSTLTLPNHAADAKKTGDEISSLKSTLSDVEDEIENCATLELHNYNLSVLIECLKKVAWIDEDGKDLIDEFVIGTNPPKLIRISPSLASYTSVDVGDTIESLRNYITVTAYYDDDTAKTVTGYTLPSENLSNGVNDIEVILGNMSGSLYVYAPSNNDQGILYKIPNNTELQSAIIDTGIKLHDFVKDYTILAKIIDKTNIAEIATGTTVGMFFNAYGTSPVTGTATGERLQIDCVDDNGVKKKKYNLGVSGVNMSSMQSNANHTITCATRIKVITQNVTAERWGTFFVDGTKIQTHSSNVEWRYVNRPLDWGLLIGKIYNETAKRDNETAFTGTVELFEIYNRALTDSEINQKLGVTV